MGDWGEVEAFFVACQPAFTITVNGSRHDEAIESGLYGYADASPDPHFLQCFAWRKQLLQDRHVFNIVVFQPVVMQPRR